jgi:hypothetical protein
MPSHTDLVLEITPEGAPAFRAEAKIKYLGFNMPMHHYIPPLPGETVHVQFDPKSHKVKVVLDEVHNSRVAAARSTNAIQDALNAAPGSGLPGDDLAGGYDGYASAEGGMLHLGTATIRVASNNGEQEVPITRADPSAGGTSGILRDGVDCTAIVLAAFPLGQKTSTGEDATGLVLQVTVLGSPTFQAQIGMYVPPAAAHLLAPGTTVPAKALPGQLNMVAIDWPALIAAGR